MSTASDSKYGIVTAEKKEFHPDEPLFILRATDPLTPAAIRDYARRATAAGCAREFVDTAMARAHTIEAWQDANPALVKVRPD